MKEISLTLQQSVPKHQNNRMKQGLKDEKKIIWLYKNKLDCKVSETGFVISESYPFHTPYSKMAATQDGLGRGARKRGIEGHGTRDSTRQPQGNGHIANSGEKSTETANYHSLPT